jgi:hypothetical protein
LYRAFQFDLRNCLLHNDAAPAAQPASGSTRSPSYSIPFTRSSRFARFRLHHVRALRKFAVDVWFFGVDSRDASETGRRAAR